MATKVVRTDDVGETVYQELDKEESTGIAPQLIKKTIRQEIYYWPDGMAYALPKVHEAQWLRQGMSRTPPPARKVLKVECEICGKQITAGANFSQELLKKPEVAERAKEAARILHIMQKHPSSAIVVLSDSEFDKAMKLLR